MLIYNYKKEFLGIDENDLKTLGLIDLADLRNEAADFADLFIKTPGYIHNFKHVHWIDYILCNDEMATAKAIIHIKGKNYAVTLDIKSIYLVDNPTQRAFIINLLNIRVLSQAQSEQIAADVLNKPTPAVATGAVELITMPSSISHDDSAPVEFDPYESHSPQEASTAVVDIYETPHVKDEVDSDVALNIELEGEDEDEDAIVEPEVQAKPKKEEVQKPKETAFNNYEYNPEIASEELGLPIDLIEEFIQDFISQAHSFKDDLYQSAQNQDANQLKIQSHKLKGVAANLRIEDALDALTTINTSDNYDEIQTELGNLYQIIDKLSQKNHTQKPNIPNIPAKTEREEEEDDLVLSFKDDVVIEDDDVPEKISVAELADDEFLESESNNFAQDIDTEDLSILEESAKETPTEKIDEEALDIAISYDKKSIADDMGLDIDSFNELFNEYINETHILADVITISIEEKNLQGCKNAASKLKGMSDNMRIHKFDDELDIIINSIDINDIQSHIDTVITQLDQISKAEDN